MLKNIFEIRDGFINDMNLLELIKINHENFVASNKIECQDPPAIQQREESYAEEELVLNDNFTDDPNNIEEKIYHVDVEKTRQYKYPGLMRAKNQVTMMPCSMRRLHQNNEMLPFNKNMRSFDMDQN